MKKIIAKKNIILPKKKPKKKDENENLSDKNILITSLLIISIFVDGPPGQTGVGGGWTIYPP